MRNKTSQIKKNKELIEKYPFLKLPHIDDYSYTALDDMPNGWRKAFGEKICEEINDELVKSGIDPSEYTILQIKEKYGALRWYDSGGTDGVDNIIRKYENISERTCIHCGKPAQVITTGWISPFCNRCFTKLGKDVSYKSIKDWFKEDL